MNMMKSKLLIMLSVVLIFLTGCSHSGNDSENAIQSSVKEENMTWQVSFYQLGIPYVYTVISNHIYGCYIKENHVLVDSIDKKTQVVDATFDLGNTSFISGMQADQDGNIYVLGEREERMGMWQIGTDGTFQDFTSMELEGAGDGSDIFMKGIYAGEDGLLYVWCEMEIPEIRMVEGIELTINSNTDRVYIRDKQFQPVFHTDISNVQGVQTLSFQLNLENRPTFIVKDDGGVYVQEIDVERKCLGEQKQLNDLEDFFDVDYANRLENITPVDNGFLYCQNNELYEFNYDTQKTAKVLNLSAYGILSSELLTLSKNDDSIEMIDNHGNLGKQEYISFTPGDNTKKVVTLGVTGMAQDLESIVTDFNRYNSEYRVEIVDYVDQTGSYEDALERLKLDIVTGDAPDIIRVSGIDYDIFSKKGVLADLYEFMQKDTELNKDMLVASVSSAYEDNGHLYSMSPGFQLHTMWGYADVTDGKSGVSFEELFRLLEKSGKDMNAIGGFSADEPVLTRLCTVSMDEFVDWESGTCDFTGDYFKKVLTFAKEYTGNYTGGTYSERIQKREVVLSVGIIASVADYQIQKELYGGDVEFIGYPVAEGNGMAFAFRGSAVAINGRKEDQTGAWEFVKYYLLNGYDGQGFPVIQKQFDQVMADAMKEDESETEDGETERYPKASYYDGNADIYVYAASKEDVDTVVGLIENTGNRFKPHTEIQNIINEDAEGYFSGQVDLDKAVEKIQNRVNLLLQEQK